MTILSDISGSVAGPAAAPYILGAKVIAVAALAVGLYGAGYHRAYVKGEKALESRVAEDQKVIDKLRSDYNVAVASANAIAQGNTQVLHSNVTNIANNLKKDNQNAHTNNANSKPLVFHATPSPVASLRVQPKESSSNGGQHSPYDLQGNSYSGVANGTGNQAICRPDDATQLALRAIAQDGDDAIRQLNAVIDAYNVVRSVGCSVTPASQAELQTLLSDTAIDPANVVTEETKPSVTISKIKSGVFSIGPLLLPALIPGSALFVPAIQKAVEQPSPQEK